MIDRRRTFDDEESPQPDPRWPGSGRRASDSSSRRQSRRGQRQTRQVGDPRGANDRWLVSYADFITLLLAFFTTMYAASSVDARKLGTMVKAMQKAFDTEVTEPTREARGDVGFPGLPERVASPVTATEAMPTTEHPVPIEVERYDVLPIPVATSGHVATVASAEVPSGRGTDDRTLSHVLARLSEQLADEIVRGTVTLEMDRRGLVVSIRESGTFETGSADLSADTQRLVGRLAASLAGLPNPLRIEGHTDNVPIHTARYGSNWELSTARAVNVVAFLVQEVGLEPTRLSAAGYSEFHPRVPNDSASHRARNRRVDLIVLDPKISRVEEPLRAEGPE